MDWNHFLDDETGQFKLKRLPPIRKPVRVVDKTDLSGEHSLFRDMDMIEGLDYYKESFSEPWSYEPEIDEAEEAMNSASAEDLGPLAAFRGYLDEALQLLEVRQEEGWLDAAVELPEKVARKAESARLVDRLQPDSIDAWKQYWMRHTAAELKSAASGMNLKTTGTKPDLSHRLAEHVSANPADAPKVNLVRATVTLSEAVQTALGRILNRLDNQLRTYPPAFQQAVWSEIRIDWAGEHWKIEEAIPDHELAAPTPKPAPIPARRQTSHNSSTTTQRQSTKSSDSKRTAWVALAVVVVIAWLFLR